MYAHVYEREGGEREREKEGDAIISIIMSEIQSLLT